MPPHKRTCRSGPSDLPIVRWTGARTIVKSPNRVDTGNGAGRDKSTVRVPLGRRGAAHGCGLSPGSIGRPGQRIPRRISRQSPDRIPRDRATSESPDSPDSCQPTETDRTQASSLPVYSTSRVRVAPFVLFTFVFIVLRSCRYNS